MRRKQFTFYRSFLEAIQALPKKEQLPFALALITYALDGDELPLSGSAASAFCIVKPLLDSSRRRAESGSLGGKQAASKSEANTSKTQANTSKHKQTDFCLRDLSKQEKEQEKEQVKDQDKDEDEDKGEGDPAGDVVVIVEGRLGTSLSQRQKDALWGFADSMGEACVLKALDAAQDAGRLNFGYIRGVLENKLAQGVKSAEDWDKAEERHKTAKGGKDAASGTPRDVQPSPERAKQSADWLEEFLAGQEGKV